MQEYITLRKTWYDNELTELKVVCSSTLITASAEIYINDRLIDELVHQLRHFLNGDVTETCWANTTKGDDSVTCVAFRFMHKDKLGHIWIEVYMELDDGGKYSEHNCCFYINTEMGQLEEFCKKILILKEKRLWTEVTLNDEC